MVGAVLNRDIHDSIAILRKNLFAIFCDHVSLRLLVSEYSTLWFGTTTTRNTFYSVARYVRQVVEYKKEKKRF